MRKISCSKITEIVKELSIQACYELPDDLLKALKIAYKKEKRAMAKDILKDLMENAKVARMGKFPICQDTGMAVVFIDIGQDAHIMGGNLEKAIIKGIRQGYKRGGLRNSVVKDPIHRENTGDNTPPVIHYNLVAGDNVKITVVPKGFGSENMSRLKMLTPADGIEGIKKFVVDTIKKAGAKSCPPFFVGVGVGGNFEKCAYLARKALLRPIDKHNNDAYWKKIENEILREINKTNIGPQGLRGETTAFAVHIETFPTHIAALPVAVNISCHASRKAHRMLLF